MNSDNQTLPWMSPLKPFIALNSSASLPESHSVNGAPLAAAFSGLQQIRLRLTLAELGPPLI